MSNQRKYNTFRQMFPRMVYESFEHDVQPDGLHIEFCFRLSDKIAFRPTAFIPNRDFLHMDLPREVMDNLVFHIGMIELVSYWKCVCSPVIEVRPFALSGEQVDFWKKLYWNGLGEFYYVNGIRDTLRDFVQIESRADAPLTKPFELPLTDSYLVPIGGGKDSVVTLEALRSGNCDIRPLIMNPRGATTLCAQRGGFEMDQVLEIKRTIHPQLLDLNKQGCLNGHTPFSAMLGFYTLLASALSGRKHIALSNESSANESTVVGTSVNHQYSKSLEFENDFRAYVAQFVSPSFNYFSFLRPLSELQIASLFARKEQYFDVFKSCNAGSKQDIWCGKCAKCLFAYIILSPFIEPERLNGIFGKNMLDDAELRPLFDQLIGAAETKPFECVGTVSEVNSALSLTLSRWYPTDRPALLKDYCATAPTTPLDTFFAEHNLNSTQFNLLTQYAL